MTDLDRPSSRSTSSTWSAASPRASNHSSPERSAPRRSNASSSTRSTGCCPPRRSPSFLPVLAERFARERLRALGKVEGSLPSTVPGVLFLCVHNAGRSQMAAGWLRHLAGDAAVVWSGGSEPTSEINPGAVAAMAEVGIDITTEFPKPWTDEVVRAADVVITMGCGDACPLYPGKRYEDWELDDPDGMDLDAIRPIRDEIRRRVQGLLASLSIDPS